MIRGRLITTFNELYSWCLVKNQPIFLRSKQGGTYTEQGWRHVSSTPFGALTKMLSSHRIFRAHKPGTEVS